MKSAPRSGLIRLGTAKRMQPNSHEIPTSAASISECPYYQPFPQMPPANMGVFVILLVTHPKSRGLEMRFDPVSGNMADAVAGMRFI